MLAALTGPLAWGLFWYHIYLVWAGMTTNESSKWADWRDDITDGAVFKRDRSRGKSQITLQRSSVEPAVKWPICSTQELEKRSNSHIRESLSSNGSSSRDWKRVQNLSEIENLYDLGFWDNFVDILPDT